MNGIIRDVIFRACYTDGNVETLSVNGGKISAQAFDMEICERDGIVCPSFYAKNNRCVNFIEIEYILSESFANDDTLYFENGGCTNDRCFIYGLADKPMANIKSVTLLKNKVSGAVLGMGQVTAHRFYSWIYINGNKLGIHYEMEDKPLICGERYDLEKYVIDICSAADFLNAYADAVACLNSARPLKDIPKGFCSWSRYYENVDQEKMMLAADGLDKYARGRSNIVQIDDGWQIGRPFAGDWQVNVEKFPDMKGLSDYVHGKGMKFGIWVAPFLVGEDSPYYDGLKNMAISDITMAFTHPFDLGDPKFLQHLSETFARLTKDYGVDYYKLDFLYAAIRYFVPNQKRESVRFHGDYSVALFRRAIQTIRDAVGDDVILLSCGAPMLECVGIFDAQRVSCDIIWGNSPDFPPMWDIVKSASSTILHRYFYNGRVYMNDPDGLVFRDYDIGDGFTFTLDEAKFWATTVAMSGGLVLHNEELEAISSERRKLFTKLLYPIGVAGRPVEFFEDHPSVAIIDYSEDTKYIALYNAKDHVAQTELDLSCLNMKGNLVFDCWQGVCLGVMDKISVCAEPHSAHMYMIRRAPNIPGFLFSDGDVFLGQNIYKSTYQNGKLDIEGRRTIKENVYVFYPDGILRRGEISFKDVNTGGGIIAKIKKNEGSL